MTHQPINFRGSFQNPELLTEFSCQECQQAINEADIKESKQPNHQRRIRQSSLLWLKVLAPSCEA